MLAAAPTLGSPRIPRGNLSVNSLSIPDAIGGGGGSDSKKNGTGEDMENENEEDSHMMSRVWAGGGGDEDNWSD